jgi:hypothetical protein
MLHVVLVSGGLIEFRAPFQNTSDNDKHLIASVATSTVVSRHMTGLKSVST